MDFGRSEEANEFTHYPDLVTDTRGTSDFVLGILRKRASASFKGRGSI